MKNTGRVFISLGESLWSAFSSNLGINKTVNDHVGLFVCRDHSWSVNILTSLHVYSSIQADTYLTSCNSFLILILPTVEQVAYCIITQQWEVFKRLQVKTLECSAWLSLLTSIINYKYFVSLVWSWNINYNLSFGDNIHTITLIHWPLSVCYKLFSFWVQFIMYSMKKGEMGF